jgi:hypothetical protein
MILTRASADGRTVFGNLIARHHVMGRFAWRVCTTKMSILEPRASRRSKFALAGSIERTAEVAAELCNEGPHLSRPYNPQMVVDHIKQLLAAAHDPDKPIANEQP